MTPIGRDGFRAGAIPFTSALRGRQRRGSGISVIRITRFFCSCWALVIAGNVFLAHQKNGYFRCSRFVSLPDSRVGSQAKGRIGCKAIIRHCAKPSAALRVAHERVCASEKRMLAR